MSASAMRALPQFLRYARTYPAPQPLMTALARGPLASYGARTGALWRLEGDELVALARFGTTIEEADRYARIPLALDFDICEAVRLRAPVCGPAPEVGETRIGVVDGDFWNALVGRVSGVSLVSVPLLLADEVVGGFGFMADTEWPADDESQGFLEVLASVLALWLTHPLSPIPPVDSAGGHGLWSLALTPRQVDIMRRVMLGQRNREIASALGLSDSTVKQEVQRVMRTMRTSDRLIAAERAHTLGLM
jgi:DNA-binding CsgD family transcriptional regulator